jgi:hypothetical protein
MMLSQEHMSLNREAAIAAEMIASGVTLLGKASYAQDGLYGQAFFNLSIGFERAAKLAYIADYAIENGGQFPSNQVLKDQIGHDLDQLFNHAETISSKRGTTARPSSDIHNGIVETLTEFARGTRYYNLDLVTGAARARNSVDPMVAWNARVTEPIIAKHSSAAQRARIERDARAVDAMFGRVSFVNMTDEAGGHMDTMYAASRRTGETDIARKWAPLYVLQLARWLSFLIDSLSHEGAYQRRIEALLGLDEYFVLFKDDDRYLKGRRTWSIYRP